VPSLQWSAEALEQVTSTVRWLAANRGAEIAEAARAAVEATAQAAAARPLAYPWVGATSPSLAGADRSYRRALAWGSRLHVYYRYIESADRVLVLHVRRARQRPLGLRRLIGGE
jgi:plasmid stabilization system protein ParE